jgi:hypothetical protein
MGKVDNVLDFRQFKRKVLDKARELGREHGRLHIDGVVHERRGVRGLRRDLRRLGVSETARQLYAAGSNYARANGAPDYVCEAFSEGFADGGTRRIEELTNDESQK